MNKLKICLFILTSIFATGCPKYRPSVNFKDVESFRGQFNAHLANEQNKYYCYRDGKDYDNSSGRPHCTGATGSLADGPAKAKQVRNDLIDDALTYIDDAYGEFKNDLTAGRDRTNFVADLIELGTSAAIGITNGERPLQILGIGLTAFRGGRRSADANFFKNQSTPVLISKMNGNRAEVRAIILNNETKEISGPNSYSMGRAISDIVEYYNAGTLVEAFNKLAEDTAIQTRASERAVRVVRGDLDITDIPSVERANRAKSIDEEITNLELEIKSAEDLNPIPVAVNRQEPTDVEAAAIAAAEAKRKSALQPVRLKLGSIWKAIQDDEKFSPAIDKMKTSSSIAAILAKVDDTPDEVTEWNYTRLLGKLQATLKADPELSKELLTIIRRFNK